MEGQHKLEKFYTITIVNCEDRSSEQRTFFREELESNKCASLWDVQDYINGLYPYPDYSWHYIQYGKVSI